MSRKRKGALTLLAAVDILELLEAAADLLRRAPHARLLEDKVGDEAIALREAAQRAGVARVVGLVLQERCEEEMSKKRQ